LISEAKIAEIRQRADIAEIIGEYVTLRRAGANLKSVCPFHADTDPSFNVNPVRQMFHCFGCGASGDVFRFLMRIEGIDFHDALRRLADRYGVELPPPRPVRPEERGEAERARHAADRRRLILETAATFFEKQLETPQAFAARQMLEARRVDPATAALFRLGFAPDSWTALVDFMLSQRISHQELVDVGLARPGKNPSGGAYDAFRNRLMFTIADAGGRVIGFSGRTLSTSEDAGAKYINSPETADFVKGKTLFGLYQARVELSKQGEAILVEGNFDVVSMAAAGFRHVVAPLGTALTEEQVMLLRRRVERVVVAFDGDGAGRKASARAFPLLARAGLVSYIVALPQGEDPDSFVRNRGAAAMTEALAQRQGLLEHLIERAATDSDGSAQDAGHRIEALRPLLEPLKTAIEKDVAIQKISQSFRVDSGVIARQLRVGAPTVVKAVAAPTPERASKLELVERQLLGLLMDQPSLGVTALERGIVSLVRDEHLRKLALAIAARAEQLDSHVADIVAEADEKLEHPWLVARAMECLFKDKEKSLEALDDITATLRRLGYDEQIALVEVDIRAAQTSGDEQKILELFRAKAQLQKIQAGLRAFRKQESSVES
jgi:DNA primase